MTPRVNGARVAARGAATPWWTVPGATCVAAYQPKSAADLATSYINLANPGTYNAAPGVAPTLVAGGWSFGGTTQRLETGITPAATGWSILISLSTSGAGGGSSGRAMDNGDVGFGCVPNTTTSLWLVNGTSLIIATPITTAEVVGFAAKNAYRGGASAGTIGAGSAPANPIYIGNNAGGTRGMAGVISAIAIYSTTLSAGDVAALTTRMQAL